MIADGMNASFRGIIQKRKLPFKIFRVKTLNSLSWSGKEQVILKISWNWLRGEKLIGPNKFSNIHLQFLLLILVRPNCILDKTRPRIQIPECYFVNVYCLRWIFKYFSYLVLRITFWASRLFPLVIVSELSVAACVSLDAQHL